MDIPKIVIIALVLGVLYLIDETAGECCNSCNSFCNDCTKPTPYCGYRSCNIFGCNCECREGTGCKFCGRRRRSVFDLRSILERSARHAEEQVLESEKYLDSIFEVADVDADGRLDRFESHAWVKRNAPDTSGLTSDRFERAAIDYFSELDADHDGFLTRHEIDH